MSKRQGIMLCYPFEEKRLSKWKPPYLIQPKLDGERCRALWLGRRWVLLSSEQNEFISVPHINQALIESKIPINLELDGELYLHGLDFSSIHSIVSRTKNIHPDYSSMQFHIFDLVENIPQYDRIRVLMSFDLSHPLQIVTTAAAVCFEDVMRIYDRYIRQNYEGMIIRHVDNIYIRRRSTFLMKLKPKKSDLYEIVGYKEEVSIDGDLKGRLGSLILTDPEGNIFSAGSGLTDESRESLWKIKDSLKGKTAKIKYQHITPGNKVPRFPIFVSVVEEKAKIIEPFDLMIGE